MGLLSFIQFQETSYKIIYSGLLYRFWRGMYCRHESGVHPRESLADILPAAVEHSGALTHHIDYLAKVIMRFFVFFL